MFRMGVLWQLIGFIVLVAVFVVDVPVRFALRMTVDEPYLHGTTLPMGGIQGGGVVQGGTSGAAMSGHHTLGMAVAAVIGIAIRNIQGYPRVGVPSLTERTTRTDVISKPCNFVQCAVFSLLFPRLKLF
jgi:hypothetical protein